jgi:hypothetical protein
MALISVNAGPPSQRARIVASTEVRDAGKRSKREQLRLRRQRDIWHARMERQQLPHTAAR